MKENEDFALTAFLESAKINAPDLPEEILLKLYDVQKRHQYNDEKDRAVSTREMQKIIENFIDTNIKLK
jgi:hypothetical protein